MNGNLGAEVRIVEVGPRDGLQNEKVPVGTDLKLQFISSLAEAGLQTIEVTSFVSAQRVPQLADAEDLWPNLPQGPDYSALVPNQKGLERALKVGVKHIALFTAASEAFVLQNIGMSIDDSLSKFKEVIMAFRAVVPNGKVRGYVSTVIECPYQGRIEPDAVAAVARRLFEIGADEVSLGDTIGVSVPREVELLTEAIEWEVGLEQIAWHFHDTRGTAIANVAKALEMGVRTFDSSAAGLGGCPFAPGAGGNLATEDLVYFLERTGIKTGIKLASLAEASLPVLQALGRRPASKAQLALLARCSPPDAN